ncbi:MAG: LCP family protein [Dermatophilaceae bacterium]
MNREREWRDSTSTLRRPAEVTTSRRDVRPRSASRWRRWLTVLLVTALLIGGGTAAFAAWRLNANVTRVDVSDALGDRPAPTEAVNLLLLGSDSREGEGNDRYGTDADRGVKSDTNLLVHLAADRSWATVVSIPRDSMVPAPDDCSADAPREEWEVRQWNHNYREGGVGCLIRTLEGNTELFVDHYAVVDFRGFTTMVDALGGVDVCSAEPIDDQNSGLTLAAGRARLDGEDALAYVRTRKSVGDGSDLGRIERQQAFLSSVVQGATSSQLLARPDRLYRFLDAATSALTTDPDLGIGTMQDLATSLQGIGLGQVEFVTVPSEAYPEDLNRVQWSASADRIWAALRADRRINAPEPSASSAPSASATPSGPLTVRPDQVEAVRVLNGSGTPGLARQAVAALEVQGFTGLDVDEAQVSAAGTVVAYSGTDPDDARTVAAAFPGSRVARAGGLGDTVQVTLGQRSLPVAEVPNRRGSEPLPSPTLSPNAPTPSTEPAIAARTADADICT